MLTLIAQGLAYGAAGLIILAAGYYVVDLLTPGHLGTQVMSRHCPGASVLLSGSMLANGLIVGSAIYFNGGGWKGLDDAAIFGGVGLLLQIVGFKLLDAITPGSLASICVQEGEIGGRSHPAAYVAAAAQVGLAFVVAASVA